MSPLLARSVCALGLASLLGMMPPPDALASHRHHRRPIVITAQVGVPVYGGNVYGVGYAPGYGAPAVVAPVPAAPVPVTPVPTGGGVVGPAFGAPGYGGPGCGGPGYGVPGYGVSGCGGPVCAPCVAPRPVWRDTSHLDYDPPVTINRGDHLDYVPGHYHVHRSGMWTY